MNWQIKYALRSLQENSITAKYLGDELILISVPQQPDVLAAITDAHQVSINLAQQYRQAKKIDFLCGYREACVWEGDAIRDLESSGIGWGNLASLLDNSLKGTANTASHKAYLFSNRLLHQYKKISSIEREFDRIYRISVGGGPLIRIAMINDYETTADTIRTMWENFGPVDVFWNINPNGRITRISTEVAKGIKCRIIPHNGMNKFLDEC